MRPLPRVLICSVPSIFCYIYVASFLLGPSHQSGLFKIYLLSKLVLKKGPTLLPIPIPIKIPQEPKIVKVPVMHTSQHVHIHYHNPPPHQTSIYHYVPQAETVHSELIKEGFSTTDSIDHDHITKTHVEHDYTGHSIYQYDAEDLHGSTQPLSWPHASTYFSPETRQVLA